MLNDKINTEGKKKKSSGILKWLIIFTTIFLFFVIIALVCVLFFESAYSDVIYPGVHAGGIDLGGKTKAEAQAILEKKYEKISKDGIIFFYGEKQVVVPIEIFGNDPDLSRVIISIDIKQPAEKAYVYGRDGSIVQNLIFQLLSFVASKNIPISYTVNEKQVLGILKNGFKDMENPGRDATLSISNSTMHILKEQEGAVFDYEKGIQRLNDQLFYLLNTPIELEQVFVHPKITTDQAMEALPLAEEIMQTSTPRILYEAMSWKIDKGQVVDWLEFYIMDSGSKKNEKPVGIHFNHDRIVAFLQGISDKITIEPIEAKFELVGGRVTQFQASRNGRKINYELTYNKINKEYFLNGNSEIDIIVDSMPPLVSTKDINNLGIKEQIGIGITNFSGSPKNRRLNIANGAKLLNGLLIKPQEELSLINALKPFDATNGFLQELVIKGDRTIPEFGGGLCQIATTIFRTTLNAGLPITERRNHSYRVSYYEPPAGIDATIYEPSPDYKFINDTPGHILLIAAVDKDDLIIKFFGTSDGRKSEISPEKPKIYNITDPGEPRFIDTDTLPPGEKKLVEKPHKGADTSFDYIVTYSDGITKKTTFASRYVAWKETWLVGKAATSTDVVLPDGSAQILE